MSRALHLPVTVGEAFCHDGVKLVFRGRVGDRLHITDAAGNIYLVYDPDIAGEAMPDQFWFWQEYTNGRIANGTDNQARFARLERLDISAAVVRDPGSLKRFTWARMARAAKLGQNQQKVQAWIDRTPCPPVPTITFAGKDDQHHQSITAKLSVQFAKKPGARSVMTWMATLAQGHGIGAFVNKAGRPLHHSQLPPKIDALVDAVKDLYWQNPKDLPAIEDAAALVHHIWRELKARGELEIGTEPPVYETTRKRIRRSETFENYEKRYGTFAARAKFAPKGEPVSVTHPFELIFMDGVEFEHYTRYSDSWGELAGKMKGIAAMDAYSFYKWPYAIFYGPFRPEMSIEAIMNVCAPRPASGRDIEADPSCLIYGVPTTIAFDNDKALLPPSLVPHLSLLAEIQLIGTYHPNGKSPLELSFKHDKQQLAHIKGRVLPPGRSKDPRYDPAKEADLTKAQYVFEVEKARRRWNSLPKASLGDRSPNDVMLEYLKTHGVQRYGAC